MKFLCTADWHLHNFSDYATIRINGVNSRANWILKSIKYILSYAMKNSIQYILVAGDLFHQRGKLDVALYNALHDVLNEYYGAVTCIILPGNHDNIDNSDSPEFSFRKFDDVAWVVPEFKCIQVKSDPLRGSSVEADIFCVPYIKNTKKTKEILKEFGNSAKKSKNPILLAHIGVSGGYTGKEHYTLKDMYEISDLMPECYKYVVLGHYHMPQILPGTTNAFYCGMPLQRDFNDEGSNRGFFVVDTDKRWDIQFVEIPNTPKFITLDFSYDFDWDSLANTSLGDNFFKVLYTDSKELEFLNSKVPRGVLYKAIPKKQFKSPQRVNNVSIDMSFHTIVSNWAKRFNPEAENVGLGILNESLNKK